MSTQQDLVLAQERPLAARQTELQQAVPLDAILRAAQEPGTDVAKMEALVGLYERMQDRSAKQAFNASMVACQAEMPRVTKDKRIIHEAKPGKTGMSVRYATYERIDECVRPIYQQHGFSVQFSTATPDAGKYLTTATVRHLGGHSETYTMPLQLDQTGGKSDIQGMGSTMAYARRYLLTMIFNIVTEGDDNDGNGAPALITVQQADNLRTRLDATTSNKEKFCQTFGIQKLEDLPANRLNEASELIKRKESRQ